MDTESLITLTSRLVGQRCAAVEPGYADELTLHFGNLKSCPLPRGGQCKEGDWILGTRGTRWQVSNSIGAVVASSEEPDETCSSGACVLEGKTVTEAKVLEHSLGLLLVFGSELILAILPGGNDDDEDVAYWELFTPQKMLLEVGPRGKWSYVSSNAAISK